MPLLTRARHRLAAFWQQHSSLLLFTALFVAFRLQALLLFRPGGYIADFSDYEFYYALGQLAPRGYHPGANLVTAYPPLFPTLVVSLFQLASRVPLWSDPRLVFYTLVGATLLIFETGNFLLIARLARRLHPSVGARGLGEPAWRPPLIYALLFAPVYTMLGWFEAMPLFFALLGLELLLTKRRDAWLLSAVALGLGALTKLVPVALVPVGTSWLGLRFWERAWWRGESRRWLKPLAYGLAFVATVALGGLLLTRANPSLATSSLAALNNRPPWQSIWALLDGYFGYGVLPLDARNVTGLSQPLWQSRLPWGAITTAFGLLYAWLLTRPYDWERPRTAVALAGVSVLLLMLLNRGWSPQFIVWVLAFVALLLPGMLGAAIAILLSLINFVESSVYLILVPNEQWLLWGTVLLRTVLLIALVALFLGQIWPTASAARMRKLGRGLAWAAGGAAVIAALVAAPPAARAYAERRLADHPCRDAVTRLQAEASWPAPQNIATAQTDAWQLFYPWLNRDYRFTVLDDYPLNGRDPAEIADERLTALAQEGEFWWLELEAASGNGNRMIALAGRFFARPETRRLEQATYGQCRLSRVVVLPDAPVATADVAGGPIMLRRVDMTPAQAGGEFGLVLFWEAAAPVDESYTVFTQVLDASGRIVAQQDNPPGRGESPTNTWEPGALVRDLYTLRIPGDAQPGAYRLLVGLYKGETRRTLTFADGAQGDALSLPVQIGRQP